MALASFLKTFMATSVVNLLMYEVGTDINLTIGQFNLGRSDRFIVAGCFSFILLFCFPLLGHLFICNRDKKTARSEQ